jgi:hypothetical protein
MNDVIFLRDGSETGPRNEPWPQRPYLLIDAEATPVLTRWRVAVVIAVMVAFVTGYAYGVVVTRRAVAVEAEMNR